MKNSLNTLETMDVLADLKDSELNSLMKRSVRYIVFSVRSRGFAYLFGEAMFKLVSRIFRKYLHPTLEDFFKSGFLIVPNALSAINSSIRPNSPLDIETEREFNLLKHKLELRMSEFKFSIGSESSRALYYVIRAVKPSKVVETGVANGISTYFILNGLLKNGSGTLTSFDVSENVGRILTPVEKECWELIVLKNNYRSQFKSEIDKIQSIGVYLHDGDHSYDWQMMEYKCAFQKLQKGGVIVSDDVDSSLAFLDFFSNKKATILTEPNKLFGMYSQSSDS